MDVLVVDAGGSGVRCVRQVGDHAPREISGPGVAILDGRVDLEDLLARCHPLLTGTPPQVTCWGVRGLTTLIDGDELHRRVVEVTGVRAAGRVVVASDAVTAAAGAVGGVEPVVVTAIGSGIVTLATDFADVWCRVDGWGHVLGDRGSGAWIGRHGLAAALAAADEVPGGSSVLLEAARRTFGPELSWPGRVMGVAHATSVLASFVPAVGAASSRCEVARNIILRGASHVLDALQSAGRRLPGAPFLITGGALQLPGYSDAIRDEAARRGVTVRLADGGAVQGALVLARHAGRGRRLRRVDPYLIV